MTIEEIYSEHKQAVFNHVLSVVKNYHDSEEVCNNVFIKMFRLECAVYSDKHGTALTSWIRTITNHQIFDFFRTNHQNHYKAVSDFADGEIEDKTYMSFVAPKNDNADTEVLTAELQSRLDKAFYELKPEYRRVASMYFIHQYDYIEISDMLNVPMGTVKGMLNRSRAMLQEALEGVYTLRKVNVQTATA